MTTFATNQDTGSIFEQLDARTRDAWASYSARLQDLVGSDYDEAERDAWADLQAALRAIDGERAELQR